MAIVTGDRYLESLVRFVERRADDLLDGSLTLRLNPVGLHYVQSRLDALQELEGLLAGAPVDYLRAYVSDLGDHRALEQLRRILGLLTSLKVISVLPPPARDPTPLCLLSFGRLKVLELRGCDLSTKAAKGLLELRGSLEKLVCHNSTDALRHVFASRIADIKDSPVWKRLSFVSCASNSLVLMDESLQLLPAVETLDLSRNHFAKVDNLRKCAKLQHLDLGFNHLRTIALLSEVSSPIVKLVLRNNALATLRGLENLKSLQGLDLSYNIISSFSELEILASLSCLQNLWLEGNPICCARWYRSHVYSFFSHPESLKLDEKGISTSEFWERHIILAGRQKRPAGYGFYFPAKHDASNEGGMNRKRVKNSRLACIEDDEQRRFLLAEAVDRDSASCDSDNTRKDEPTISDGEAEIVNLINRVECLKKEQSVLWLREFKEWMDRGTVDTMEGSNCIEFNTLSTGQKNLKQRKVQKNLGESSRYVQDLALASEGGSSSNIMDSEMSFTDTYTSVFDNEYADTNAKDVVESMRGNGFGLKSGELSLDHDYNKIHFQTKHFVVNSSSTVEVSVQSESRNYPASLTVIEEIMGSRSSSTLPGSPPQYREDILHRRLDLEEEFLHQSAESLYLASSDSDTSSSGGDSCKFNGSTAEADPSFIQQSIKQAISWCSSAPIEVDPCEGRHEYLSVDNGSSCSEPEIGVENQLLHNHQKPFPTHDLMDDASGDDTNHFLDKKVGSMGKQKCKRKLRRRVITLLENFTCHNSAQDFNKSNGTLEVNDNSNNAQNLPISNESSIYAPSEETAVGKVIEQHTNYSPCSSMKAEPSCLHLEPAEIIKRFFDMKVRDCEAQETCEEVILCDCIFQLESAYQEREVAIVRSSRSRFHILLIDALANGQGSVSFVFGCHGLDDIKRIVLGLGLQTLRIYLNGDVDYLFITRTIEKSRDLLSLLEVFDSTALHNRCSLQSWEQVQVKMLEKQLHGNLKSIFFYSMLLFHHAPFEGQPWSPRSLFVIEGQILVCVENLVLFSCSTDEMDMSSSYYSIDLCCQIQNIQEMVIEIDNDRCTTLSFDLKNPGNTIISKTGMGNKQEKGRQVSVWKLKWYSQERLLKFASLIKAIHAGLASHPLLIKCIS